MAGNTNNQPKVHIYIDNSNLYIQGSKTYPSSSHQNPVSDPSWRYDIGRLLKVLRENSGLEYNPTVGQVHTILYGSVPPPTDIWKALASPKVTVHTFERSSWNGREKQVDTKMVVDITRQATKDQLTESQAEFIIVTGDGDLYPAVETVIESGFRVHIWSWKHSLSSIFRNTDENDIRLHYLDDFKDEFGYHQPAPSLTPCKYGENCHWNLSCRFQHSQAYLERFK